MPDQSPALERLRAKLYKKESKERKDSQLGGLSSPRPTPINNWEEPKEKQARRIPKQSLPVTFLLGSMAFFAVALLVGGFLLFRGGNVVSNDQVSVRVDGPTILNAGDSGTFRIEVINGSAESLRDASLTIEYPSGAYDAQNPGVALTRVVEELPLVPSGERGLVSQYVLLYGQANEEKDFRMTLSYAAEGSTAIFEKKTVYTVLIGTAPLSLSLSVPKESGANQEILVSGTITSNSTTTLRNVAFQFDTPPGFEVLDYTPEGTTETLWQVGDLAPKEAYTVTIRGIIRGQDSDPKVFKGMVGMFDREKQEIKTVYALREEELIIRRAFLSADIVFDDVNSDTIAVRPNEVIQGVVKVRNNTPGILEHAVIEVVLPTITQKTKVVASEGFYDSGTNTIRFDERTMRELESLQAGKEVDLQFSFSVRGGEVFSQGSFVLTSNVRATRPDGTVGEVKRVATATGKLQSNAVFFARAVYFIGPFDNSGSIPPRADQETTYTVIFTIANGANPISDARITATLPPGVRFTGSSSPQGESFFVNPDSGILTWNAGTVAPGAGYTIAPKEIAFQVALKPNVSQVGQTPVLVDDISVRARDQFTDTTISDTLPRLTTNLSTDPQAGPNSGKVVR